MSLGHPAGPGACFVIAVCRLDQMRQYFTQMRQEMGLRLVEKVFGAEDKPSKVGFWGGLCLSVAPAVLHKDVCTWQLSAVCSSPPCTCLG